MVQVEAFRRVPLEGEELEEYQQRKAQGVCTGEGHVGGCNAGQACQIL